jgi:predicted N-formylglutamate amidohydrolase
MARELSAATNSWGLLSNFSRLIIDPNRDHSSETLIRARAEDDEPVHMNQDLDEGTFCST